MKELFVYFLKLGTTGFGGPIALLGLMEQHWVRDKKTVSAHDFHQYVAAAKLFPGPLAALVAIRIGCQMHGKKGGMLAALGLILPAFFMVLLISYFFGNARNHSNHLATFFFMGLNLGGLALSIIAAIRFSKPLISSETLFYLLSSAILTFFYPKQEIFFLLGCGTLSLLYHRFKNLVFEASSSLLALLFFESFKASLLTFGSGIAIVPVLKAVYIDQYHWVSNSDFLTALSIGQMTPGPLVILNTYLANQIAQLPGAALATTGTFLPTFIFGLFVLPYFEKKLLGAPTLKTFFKGMLPAVGGAILGSVLRLCLFAVNDNAGIFSFSHAAILILLTSIGLTTKFHPIAIMLIGSTLTVLGSLAGIIQ